MWMWCAAPTANGIQSKENVQHSKHVSVSVFFCVQVVGDFFIVSLDISTLGHNIHNGINSSFGWEIHVNSLILRILSFFSFRFSAVSVQSTLNSRTVTGEKSEIRKVSEKRAATKSTARVPDTKWHNKIKVSPLSLLRRLFVEYLFFLSHLSKAIAKKKETKRVGCPGKNLIPFTTLGDNEKFIDIPANSGTRANQNGACIKNCHCCFTTANQNETKKGNYDAFNGFYRATDTIKIN